MLAYLRLARYYSYGKSDSQQSLSTLEQASKFDPGNLEFLGYKAEIYSKLGDFQTSKELFSQLRQQMAENNMDSLARPWLSHRYAYTLWHLGMEGEAIRYFEADIRPAIIPDRGRRRSLWKLL